MVNCVEGLFLELWQQRLWFCRGRVITVCPSLRGLKKSIDSYRWYCALPFKHTIDPVIYNWRLSRYSVPIHWLFHGHMTSNNKTVSRKMPWAGNIAKNVWRQTGNSSLLPAKCWLLFHVIRGGLMLSLVSQRVFQNLLLFCFALGNFEFWILFLCNLSRETEFTVPLGTSH